MRRRVKLFILRNLIPVFLLPLFLIGISAGATPLPAQEGGEFNLWITDEIVRYRDMDPIEGWITFYWEPVSGATAYHLYRDGKLNRVLDSRDGETYIYGSTAGGPVSVFWASWESFKADIYSASWQIKAILPNNGSVYSNIILPSAASENPKKQVPVEKTVTVGEPINVASGNMFITEKDIFIPSRRIPLALSRTYNSQDDFNGSFGYGWRSDFDLTLHAQTDGSVIEIDNRGVSTVYTLIPDGSYHTSPGKYSILTKNPDQTYQILRQHGDKLYFDSSGLLTKIEDRNGNYLNLTRDPHGVLLEAADSSGRKLLFTSDTQGKITQVTDPAGRIFQYAYDLEGNLIKVTDPLNQTTLYTYDAKHNLIQKTAVNSRALYFEYDSNDRVFHSWQDNQNNAVSLSFDAVNKTTTTDALGSATTYEYNDYGLVTKITDSQGKTRLFNWDNDLNKTSSTDQNGFTAAFTYDTRGNLLTVKDALGSVTTFTYEPNFDFPASVVDALGNKTTYAYDAQGNLIQVKDALQNTTNYAYDTLGQLIQVQDANSNTTSFAYDTLGNLTQITDALNNSTYFSYDLLGNKTQNVDAQGNITNFTYDLLNRLIRITYADNAQVTYTYDPAGNLVSFADQNGNTTAYTYDVADRLIQITDAEGNITQYAYDLEGNCNTITDALGNKTQYFYDCLKRLAKTADPLNNQTLFSYDPAGNLTAQTDAQANITHYSYDALNRLTAKTYPDSTQISYTYDSLSRLSTVQTAYGTTSYTYDSLGRQTAVQYPNALSISSAYDPVGNKTKLTYPDGSYLTYTYDPLNRLTQIQDSEAQSLAAFAYDHLSRRTNLTLANGVTASYTYNPNSRLLSLVHQKKDSTVISSFNYAYDPLGNRLSLLTPQGGYNYTYNHIAELTRVQKPNLNTVDYCFDALGNRIKVTDHAAVYTYTVNSLNQYTQIIHGSVATNLVYDVHGNLTSKTSSRQSAGIPADTTFSYDYENRLNTVTQGRLTTTFAYDAFGRRVARALNGRMQAKYVYDGENIILDLDPADRITAKYIYGPNTDEPLILIKGENKYYYSSDGLGSVVNITDSSGKLVEAYAYGEYGKPLNNPSFPAGNHYLFIGREYDRETGLYYYRSRYYDPALGRFLQRDPLGYAGGMNLYGYVKNNPVNWTDAWGWCADEPGLIDMNWQIDLAVGGMMFGPRMVISGLYAGENAVFYSGPGARALAAASSGIPIFKTAIGNAMEWIQLSIGIKFPRIIWDTASAIYAATARGTAQVFLSEGADYSGTFARVEAPVLSLLEALGKVEMVFR